MPTLESQKYASKGRNLDILIVNKKRVKKNS